MVFFGSLKKLKYKIDNKIPQPEDVYTATYPLYITSNIIGLSPYSLKRIENGGRVFQHSILHIIRSVVLAIGMIALVLYSVYICKLVYDNSYDFKEKLRYILQTVSSFTSICDIIFACVFAKSIIEVFKNIDDVDKEFKRLAVWVPYKEIYIYIILHLTIAVIICGFFFVIFELYVGPKLFKDYDATITTNYVILVITYLLPSCLNILMELQYVHYVNILRMRYRLLNEYLEALIQENKSYNGWVDDIGISTTETISEKLQTPTGKIPKSIVAISDPIFVVDQVASLHIKITDTAHLINYTFSVQQLLRVGIAFVSIVIALFSIAKRFSNTTGEGSELDLYFTTWALCNAFEIMIIVWITSETCEEANTCPRILHRIRNNTTNAKLQDTIEIYSLQMYHNRLYFTICGLFPLDYTLLYTIVAGVTTYLVILIQFSGNEFNKKANGSAST